MGGEERSSIFPKESNVSHRGVWVSECAWVCQCVSMWAYVGKIQIRTYLLQLFSRVTANMAWKKFTAIIVHAIIVHTQTKIKVVPKHTLSYRDRGPQNQKWKSPHTLSSWRGKPNRWDVLLRGSVYPHLPSKAAVPTSEQVFGSKSTRHGVRKWGCSEREVITQSLGVDGRAQVAEVTEVSAATAVRWPCAEMAEEQDASVTWWTAEQTGYPTPDFWLI